jgi:hypothetical protein
MYFTKLQKLEIELRSIKLQNLKLIVYFKMYTCKLKNGLSSNTKLEGASIPLSQISLNNSTSNPKGLKVVEIAKSHHH